MLTIKFYKGEERDVVREDNLEDSIFHEQYDRAMMLAREFVSSPSDRIPNIIAFCGDRGEGKTSCMTSVIDKIEKEGFGENHQQNNAGRSVYRLSIIDPAFFDEEHNVIQLMLGQMFDDFSKCYITPPGNAEKRKEIERLNGKFQKAKHCLSQLKQPRERIYDPLEDLDSLAAAERLKESLGELIEEFLEYNDKEYLIMPIDDIDLNIDGAYEMVEQIRKYVISKKCLIMISLNVDQLIDVISNYLQKKAVANKFFDTEEMAAKYVAKLIPVGSRVVMPKVYDICNMPLKIYNSREENEQNGIEYHSLKEAVVQLIYNKTRYLFYNSKGGVSPIVPNNLRSLRHLLGMLTDMDDFENNTVSESNKHAFRAYFFQNWIHQLKREDQAFAGLMASTDDASLVNKMVVSYLANYVQNAGKLEGSLLGDILNPQNYGYNISVGDVFYVVALLDKSNVNHDLRQMLFFIKSFYGMRLYEFYDVITEKEGEMFPEAQYDGEIFKSDAWFNRTNLMQRLVNGAYFTYEPDDLLPVTADGGMNRDLKLINAMHLRDRVYRTLKDEMARYDDMTDNEKRDFENRFKITEFFVMLTKRPMSRRKADQYDRMRRDYAEPFHLSDINFGTGYIVIDVTAPFCNVLNLKYTYGRLSFLRGSDENAANDFYGFAKRHEWSLLRSMIRHVRMKRHNEEHPNDKKDFDRIGDTPEDAVDGWIKKLASDAIIRNGEVLASLSEMMQNRRTNMHNRKDNCQLLAQFYGDIIQSNMRTYRNKATDRPYYIQFTFLKALVDLLTKQGPDSLLEQIYETGVDTSKTTNDDVLSVFRDFFALNFKTKKRSAIKGDFRKKCPEYASRLAESDWDNMFPDAKKSYPREDIVAVFRENFFKITSKAKATDEYFDDEI